MSIARAKSKCRRIVAALFALAIFAFTAINAAAQSDNPAHTPTPLGAPLDITVPANPTAFKAGSEWHLVYELHVANLGKWDCQLTRIEVLAADRAAIQLAQIRLASFADKELEALMSHPGQDAAEKTKITPGSFAVAYLWLTFDKLEYFPAKIQHRIAMKVGDYPEAITLEGVPVTVNKNPVAVIAPPLRGENWLAGNGPSNISIHRRALIPVGGRARIAQRYAIDWVQLYPGGKTHHGDAKDNRNYRAYGAEIHAVADGVVMQTKDGIQQNVPNEKPAVPITLETIGGNHVIVDIGNGLFAFYAHMQPGSVRVKPGDHVRRGDTLGLVGNSGNSSEPHLHFHLCDANSELACEGVPYAFAAFELQGNGWAWRQSEPPAAPLQREMEMPAENDVVRFNAP
jgi:murein DD-endopeptidase